MSSAPAFLAVLLGFTPEPLAHGDHTRSVRVGAESRPYLLHVPPSYDPQKPTPVVLALHPFATNGPLMALISGLSQAADRKGFLVAYPNGTGQGAPLHWNVGAMAGDADDVGYLTKVLDDLAAIAKVDPRRVYATGFSNGGMMCYRLASELSDRIAAIAPVAGTMTAAEVQAQYRPVPVLHFHGTRDAFVSYNGRVWREARSGRFKGVEETVRFWARIDGCPETPVTAEVPRKADDGLVIERIAYGPGREGSEVVLYKIVGGGHAWPGRALPGKLVGKSALDLDANELIWEFFVKHPMR